MDRDHFLSELIPLLVPPTGNRLWIISRQGIEFSRRAFWTSTMRVEPALAFDFICSASEHVAGDDAVLVLDTQLPDAAYQELQRREITFAVASRFRSLSQATSCNGQNWRIGLPAFGHPLIWSTMQQVNNPPLEVFPRGRFDRHLLRLSGTAFRLGIHPKHWHVRADPMRSLIANFLLQAKMHDGAWYQTRTGKLIIADVNRVLKINIRGTTCDLPQFVKGQRHTARESLSKAGLEQLLAESQGCMEIAGFKASVEARLPGRSAFLSLGLRSDLERIISNTAAFLERWYEPHSQQVEVTDEVFDLHWREPLTPLRDALVQQGRRNTWRAAIESLRCHSIGRSIRLVPIHGDLWLNNILVDDETFRITGILDWDLVEHGLPCLDLFHLLTWRTQRFRKDFSNAVFDSLTQARNTYEYRIVRTQCTNLDISPDWIPILFCRYWLGEISKRSDELSLRRKLGNLVERVCHILRKYPICPS